MGIELESKKKSRINKKQNKYSMLFSCPKTGGYPSS